MRPNLGDFFAHNNGFKSMIVTNFDQILYRIGRQMFRFSTSLVVLALVATSASAQLNPMIPQAAPIHGSVVDHYQNIFQGRRNIVGPRTHAVRPPAPPLKQGLVLPLASSSTPFASPYQSQPSIGQSSLSPGSVNYGNYSSYSGFDFENAFGQLNPPLSKTVKMPVVDHSRLISLVSLHRSQLHQMVQNGISPTMAEMDGLWYGFNTGRLPELGEFSQFIKDMRTNSPNPMGTNIRVHQLPLSQLNNGNGWRPRFDLSKNDFETEGVFAIIPPDGVGPFGHAAKGVYALGGNGVNYVGNRIATRIVKLDDNFLLGQSTARVGNRYVHSGFFVLQRMPPTDWGQNMRATGWSSR